MFARSLGLLAATAVWGATFVTVKGALDDSDTYTFLALRFAAGGLTAALLGMKEQWKTSLRPGVLLGVLLFGGYAFQTVGLEYTTPSRSAFVTGLTVLFVPFVAWALSRRRPPVRAFIAPFLALAGLQQLTGVTWGEALPYGDVLTLCCAVLYAFHIYFIGRMGAGLPALPFTGVQLFTVSVLSVLCLPVTGARLTPTPEYWWAVLFTGVFASALAISVQVWAQQKLPATRAAVIYSLEPVFAVAFAALAGHGITRTELLGGALIMLAVLVSELPWPALKRRN